MNYEKVRAIRDKTRETESLMKTRQAVFGITWEQINENLGLLTDLINKQIKKFNKEMAGAKVQYWVKTNNPKFSKSPQYCSPRHNYINITAKGTYFDNREAITFCDSGFIGFCGEADAENEIPILTAFAEWLNIIGKASEVKTEGSNA